MPERTNQIEAATAAQRILTGTAEQALDLTTALTDGTRHDRLEQQIQDIVLANGGIRAYLDGASAEARQATTEVIDARQTAMEIRSIVESLPDLIAKHLVSATTATAHFKQARDHLRLALVGRDARHQQAVAKATNTNDAILGSEHANTQTVAGIQDGLQRAGAEVDGVASPSAAVTEARTNITSATERIGITAEHARESLAATTDCGEYLASLPAEVAALMEQIVLAENTAQAAARLTRLDTGKYRRMQQLLGSLDDLVQVNLLGGADDEEHSLTSIRPLGDAHDKLGGVQSTVDMAMISHRVAQNEDREAAASPARVTADLDAACRALQLFIDQNRT